MTATRSIRRVTLEDAPAIPGLTARHFHDASDYERLSELTIAASLEDGIPYLPTAQNLQVEMDAADGADPVDDMVLVELDGRVVAASGVERVVRGEVPNYQIWGTVHPDVRRRGHRDRAARLEPGACPRPRVARGPARSGRARVVLRGQPRSASARC